MPLQFSYTDQSGTTHPNAYLVYRRLRLQTDPNAGELEISIYHDAAAYAQGKGPVDPPVLSALTQSETASIAQQFGSVPYTILQGRAEYAGAQIVS